MVDQTDWDLRLGYLIHDVSRLRRMMFDRALAPLGITRSQWWVLAFISRKDGMPQTPISARQRARRRQGRRWSLDRPPGILRLRGTPSRSGRQARQARLRHQ